MRLQPRNTSLHPPGGLKHTEKASGMNFHDTSWEQMKARVYRHRIAMIDSNQSEDDYDIKAGWIERLFHDLCVQNPQVEADVVDENGQAQDRWIGWNDVNRFLSTVQRFREAGMKWEAPEKGIERLTSCTSGEEGGRPCRWHGKVHGCFSCSKIIDIAASFTDKPDMGKIEDSAMSCKLCGCTLAVKALLPLTVADDGLDYPAHCWIAKGRTA